jgi:hypothetical protein
MKTIITRLAFAALAASVLATGVNAAEIHPYEPILVDRWYEIKNPSGPVEGGWTWAEKVDYDALTEVPQYRVPQDLNPQNEPKRNIGF